MTRPSLINFTLILLIISISTALLYYGKNFLIPLVIALVVWYLIITLCNFIQKTPLIGKYIPYIVSLSLALLIFLVALWLIAILVQANITALVNSAPLYQERLELIGQHIMKYIGIKDPPQFTWTFKELNFMQLATSFAQTVTQTASSTGIIIIYVIFLLIEYHSFDKKLEALIQDKEQLAKARSIVQKIVRVVQRYVIIKIFTSGIVAILSFVVMRYTGVDFADFWAFLIFLLNFIPNIGAIIATIFPSILILVQYVSLVKFLILAISLTTLHFVMGNIIEPRLMGRSFNLSSFIIVISLAFWGELWGITGMFLCVPIMVIANIILAHFAEMRQIAIIMSEYGEVQKE